MVEENNVPHEDEQPGTLSDPTADNDLTAHVINEADLLDETDPEPEEIVENPEDVETEVLPEIPDELKEDWKQDEDAHGESAAEPQQGDGEDATVDAVSDAPAVGDKSAVPGADTDAMTTETDAADMPSQPTAQTPPPPPAKPAWKIEAERLYEEREAQKRQLFEKRRELDKARRSKKAEHEAQLRERKAQHDAQVKANFDAKEEEKQSAVEEMMQRTREERERKRREREAVDEQLRKEREARSYKNQRDIDSRASRLSKKDD